MAGSAAALRDGTPNRTKIDNRCRTACSISGHSGGCRYPISFVEPLVNPGRTTFLAKVVAWLSITSWPYFRLCSFFSLSAREFRILAMP